MEDTFWHSRNYFHLHTGIQQTMHQSGTINWDCADHLYVEVKPLPFILSRAIVKSPGISPAIAHMLLQENVPCQNPLAETQFQSPILIHYKVDNSWDTGIHKWVILKLEDKSKIYTQDLLVIP